MNYIKFNPTIVTYLLFYVKEDRITVSKKFADFTDFWTPIRCVQCLNIPTALTRYMHWYQCVYLVKAVGIV